ncbi:hypothetical protein V6N12_016821 [Hibiscus sabdariffa]|uniref:RNase H type-1 domain-containing protein n=1 Tax=Hibiscus sabdariffa TaxID=183260 RepID=A0ABR2BPT9_9ROSI
MRCRRLCAESDCLEVVKILKRKEPNFAHFTTLPHVYHLSSRDWIVIIDHIGRAQNKLVDLLAKRAYDIAGQLHVFMDPHAFIHDCFYEEQSMVVGNSVNRHLGIGLGGLSHADGASSSGIG